MTQTRPALVLLLALSAFAGVHAVGQTRPGDQPAFTVGTAKASRGQTATGAIEVPAGVDAALSIPVAVAHGAKAGPVLSLLAGAHGTEYASIIALEKLISAVDAAQLCGTVIIVPLVGKTIFEARAKEAGVLLYVRAVPSISQGLCRFLDPGRPTARCWHSWSSIRRPVATSGSCAPAANGRGW